MAKCIRVIEAETSRGRGEPHDPYRNVTQYFDCDGELLAEVDPIAPEYSRTEGKWILKAWMKTGLPSK